MVLRLIHYADLEDVYDEPEHIGRIAGLIKLLRDEQTVIIGAGDNIAPGGLSLTTNCQHTLPFFTAADAAVETLGNHDFDYGRETLLSVIRNTPQTWLCSNAYDGDALFGGDVGVAPSTILERDDHRIGLFGLANPKTDTRSPGARSVSFTDPIQAATEAIETLTDQNIDHVLCVSHLGERDGHTDEIDLARAVDVDVILGGDLDDHPRTDWVSDTLVVRTSGKGVDLSEVVYDGAWTATLHSVAEAPVDRCVERQYRDLRTREGLDQVVGTVDTPIICSLETLFQGESRLGNFITDAYRWVTDAMVALQHSAGIQGVTLQDTVTVGDLIRLAPFDMSVVRTKISGATLRDIIASGGDRVYPTYPEFWHLHLSGGTATFDYNERVLTEVTVDGEPIDPTASYSVAAPENLLRSHGVSLPSGIPCYGLQYETLVTYAQEIGIAPQLEGRITRHGLEETHS